jgi:hypothetical protein
MKWIAPSLRPLIRAVGTLACLTLTVLLISLGGRIPLQMKNLETVPCPDTPEYSNLTTSGAAANLAYCYFVQGTVVNPTNRTLLNADVFGRIYDANGNDLLPERGRLGSIDEVAPGENPFAIRISVPQTSALPLTLEHFKAAGFGGEIRR